MEPQKKTKNIGFLRRMKEKLEFRIATEAGSLSAEKDLVRQIKQVDEELNEALKGFRMRKKADFIARDIEECKKKLEEQEKLIGEQEKKLDELYTNLRKLSGMQRRSQGRREGGSKRSMQEPQHMEVSLADIAIIKDKKGEKDDEDE